MDTVAIIIPIYKETLNDNEILSLKQCLKVLKKYHFIIIAPQNLCTINYEKKYIDRYIEIYRFDDQYFKNISGYNKLLLSPMFYKSFLDFKFILIYQLDAYVFKDELKYWCDQNYDFVGAPHLPHGNNFGQMQFLKGYSKIITLINRVLRSNHKISNVGNGGFSLRKTKKCYYLLKFLKPKIKEWGDNNEDGFFKYWGNILYPVFKLPTDEIALHFSIEHSPKESLKMINTLPFGCHAFEKFDHQVWQNYIPFKN